IKRVRVSIASPLVQPSPNGRRVGIRIVTFEACSGFTRVTAHRIAQPPKATFVTRLRPFRSPGRAARQLPDQSTILWVDSSSTGDSRLRGALPFYDNDGIYQGRRGVSIDVTAQVLAERQRDELERQLRHSQKLEALGTLAGGVAHESITPWCRS